MKITLFGASGSVGKILLQEAEKRGHEVVAATRRKNSIQTSRLVKEEVVDFEQLASIKEAIKDSQAVIISLGDFDVIEPTRMIVQAMKELEISRLEILTGFGADTESLNQLGTEMRLTVKAMRATMGAMFKNKIQQSEIVREFGLDFTNVQPPTLTFDAASGIYRHGDYKGKSIFGKISRADLASFMLDNLEQERYIKQVVYVQE